MSGLRSVLRQSRRSLLASYLRLCLPRLLPYLLVPILTLVALYILFGIPHLDGFVGHLRGYSNFITTAPSGPEFLIRADQLVNPMNGRPATVDYFLPDAPEKEANLWSAVQCTGSVVNRTCIFDNLYYNKDEDLFYLLLPRKGEVRSSPYHQRPVSPMVDAVVPGPYDGLVSADRIRNLTKNCSSFFMGDVHYDPIGRPFSPELVFFEDAAALLHWLDQRAWKPTAVTGVTIYGYALYAHNVGHIMYDALYPLYVSMIRFGYGDADVNVVMKVEDRFNGKKFLCDEFWPRFGGGKYSRLNDLRRPTYRFQRVIVGSRRMAHRSFNTDTTMPGSYTYENAIYMYTQRILARYGIADAASATRGSTAVPIDRGQDGCRGVIVDNKRFTDAERAMLESIALHSHETLNCDITFIRWEKYSFEEQLRIFSEANVYVSGVGTGITRSHFIKPGGVVVNLGEMDRYGTPPRLQPGYKDVQFAVGSPHLNALYYPMKLLNMYGELQEEAVRNMIRQAVQLVRRGFPIPRPLKDGLAPTGLAMVEYCEASPEACEDLSGQLSVEEVPGNSVWCAFCTWPDYFGLDPMWRKGTSCMKEGQPLQCRLDYDLYDRVRDPNHVAFDAACHEAARPRMQKVKQKLLALQAARLGVRTSDLTDAEATFAMMQGSPPECPPVYRPQEECFCLPLRRKQAGLLQLSFMLRLRRVGPLLVSNLRRGSFIRGVANQESIDVTTLRDPPEILECFTRLDRPAPSTCSSITLRALALLPAFTLGQCATLLLALHKAGSEAEVRDLAEGVAESLFHAELSTDDSEGAWRYLEALSFSLPESLKGDESLTHMILGCACEGAEDAPVATICQGLISLLRAGVLSRHVPLVVEQLELLADRLQGGANPTEVCRLLAFAVKMQRLRQELLPRRFLDSAMNYITARTQQFAAEQLAHIVVALWRLEEVLPEFSASVEIIDRLSAEIVWKYSQLRLTPALNAIEGLTSLRHFPALDDPHRLRPVVVHVAKRLHALEPQQVLRLTRVLKRCPSAGALCEPLIAWHVECHRVEFTEDELRELGSVSRTETTNATA
ncbi:hypothetical protein FOZ61_000607 [Perkinsus olseni]|uniref:Glycosyltransferase 61 catalytic domain-containing protein n=1 Tax=Perkinsus olseni TaxID=32597 RepID=A0A7J6LZK6_PEROL|nr:hypothetical protein FOZ61_000607 [Perkinsus olseni]